MRALILHKIKVHIIFLLSNASNSLSPQDLLQYVAVTLTTFPTVFIKIPITTFPAFRKSIFVLFSKSKNHVYFTLNTILTLPNLTISYFS